jgi:ABC-type branched-subunit amino acid transport system ATPase component
MTALLRVSDLLVRYSGVVAVEDVSIDVDPGRLYGLVGPNGSGKTTLLNAIFGMVPLSAGRLEFDGRDITGARPENAARLGISRTFQAVRLVASLTVRENVMSGADLVAGRVTPFDAWLFTPRARRAARASRSIADEVLERLELTDLAGEYPTNLPYGLQRRVEIARAMATSPRLLLLDEPTAGMNASESDAIARTLLRLRQDGVTQILVDHNLRLVMGVCEHVFVMNFGRLIASGTPQQVTSEPAVRVAYLGESDAA